MPRGQTVYVAGDFVDGFLVGKAAQLAEWHLRRDEREFAALVARLRVARWYRCHRESKRLYQRARYESTYAGERGHLCHECGATFTGRRRRWCTATCGNRARKRAWKSRRTHEDRR